MRLINKKKAAYEYLFCVAYCASSSGSRSWNVARRLACGLLVFGEPAREPPSLPSSGCSNLPSSERCSGALRSEGIFEQSSSSSSFQSSVQLSKPASLVEASSCSPECGFFPVTSPVHSPVQRGTELSKVYVMMVLIEELGY
jgi:hypothetical protein